ncbi:hypothetical protein ACFQET_10235 [Levilactobacillus tangyuanensis]|uniref:Uncharacterized protein n=1 Tax=Levilactobacillus tangyuanensis TaxID=2486021 RepID=A0ABW1TQF7_9LACO|nr:hypothetical protein [Levilactobacillus tangyuanensis]
MLLKNKTLVKIVTMFGVAVSLLGIGSVTASASSKPYYGSFGSRKITYHIDSTSKHWKDNWNGAIKSWNSLHVVKLRSAKKASKANIRLTTKKSIKDGAEISGHLSGPQGIGGVLSSKVVLNRQVLSEFDENGKEQIALTGVGTALGLKFNHTDNTSAMSMFASKPNAQDKKNLQLAYKGIK